MSEHAATVLISRNVKVGCEAEFEHATQLMMQAASRFQGYLGAQLIHPGDDPDVQDTLYHVVLAFDRQASLDVWHDSPERQAGLAATAPFIEGSPRVKFMSGLGLWYRTSQPSPPPRWKVAVVTWLGIFPTVYVLFLLTSDWTKSWGLLPRTLFLTVAVVAIMTWGVAPQLTKLLRSWLFANPSKS